jgi:hypothetical protein
LDRENGEELRNTKGLGNFNLNPWHALSLTEYSTIPELTFKLFMKQVEICEKKRKSFRFYPHLLWQGGLEWIKSVQFAKEFTRHLTARKNIVAMLAPRKQTRQNKTGKTHSPQLSFPLRREIAILMLRSGKKQINNTTAVLSSVYCGVRECPIFVANGDVSRDSLLCGYCGA